MRRLIANCLGPGVAVLLVVTACTPSPKETGAGQEDTPTDSNIVAWVNGSPITEDDVTRSITKTFGPGAYTSLTDENRKTVLESLILSRAVSQRAERELAASDRAMLESEVESFREQALVKFYLKRHARPQPVTERMIAEYYDEHPERFGGGAIRIFEMIAGPAGLSGPERGRIVDAMGAADRRDDWAQYADRLRQGGMSVRYSRGELKETLLDERLVNALAQRQVGESSPITFVDGVPYVLRVVSEQLQKPRPLREVRDDIRQALMPVQLKSAIAGLSDEVMTGVEVRYAADGDQ